MKKAILILLTCLPAISWSQYKLSLVVDKLPEKHYDGDIYLTGNFNNWKADDAALKLQRLADGRLGISLELSEIPGDRVEFKFTRGSWQRAECTEMGRLTGPRTLPLQDTSITCTISGWRDDFTAHTASPNVHLLDAEFYMPQLDRYRKIWIYLPEGYDASTDRYPVVYMQDGQHLFDEATSQGRIGPIEWEVDETLDAAKHKSIVVAINHHDDMSLRIPEYYYYPNSTQTLVEGQQYLEFIVHTLKPYVDTHFRTLSDRSNTTLAGSSLGGLITLYGGLHYPQVFGNLGVFSPSIWLDEGHIEADITRLAALIQPQQRYFFYAGKNENRLKPDGTFVDMYQDTQRLIQLLEHQASPAIEFLSREDGRHGALYWREAFPVFYNWLTEKRDK